jgi:hypothetical protein
MTASDNFVEHIQGFQNHIWFIGIGSWKLKLKFECAAFVRHMRPPLTASYPLTSTFNFNFNSKTYKPYMILKALNVLYKVVTGTLLWIPCWSGAIQLCRTKQNWVKYVWCIFVGDILGNKIMSYHLSDWSWSWSRKLKLKLGKCVHIFGKN